MLGLKTRIVEDAGAKLVDMMKSRVKNKEEKVQCSEDCMGCEGGAGDTCRKRNVVYKAGCRECEEEGKKANYWGETFRCTHIRGEEHQQQHMMKRGEVKEKRWITKHAREVHERDHMEMKMEVIKKFQNTALARQVFEGILIREQKVDYLLNSKEEFHQPAEIVTTHQAVGADQVENGARYYRREARSREEQNNRTE